MITVNCPFCSTKLSAPEKYLGKKVRCHSCQKKFELQAPEPDPLAVPNEPLVQPLPAAGAPVFQAPTPTYSKSKKKRRRRASSGSFNEADSWGDMFDIGFNTFVTPKLVKVLYLMAMIGFVIYGVVITIMFFLYGLGVGVAQIQPVPQLNGAVQVAGLDTQVQATIENQQNPVVHFASHPMAGNGSVIAQGGPFGGRGMPATPQLSGGSKAIAFLLGLLTYIMTMFGLLMGLMFVRVMFEVCIAQFYR